MTVDSSRFIANHVIDLPRSGIRDFFAIVAKMPEAITLGIGEPDFVTPWHVREAAIFALESGNTSYTDNLGLIELRRVIAQYVAKHFGVDYHPEKEILVAVGVSEAMDLALRATINPGDKVLYHEPSYVSYAPSIALAHGQPIPISTYSTNHFALDPEAFINAWEPGCKIIILNFPTNPTGGVADSEALSKIARFAMEKDLLVISDEIYSELTYEGKHVSIASFPGMAERTIFLHGVSKAFAMTGFRLGFACCANADFIEAMMKIHQYGIMCASIVSQKAAIEALKNGEKSMTEMVGKYRQRKDYIVRRFNEIGLPCHTPKGTFYTFPDIRPTGLDEKTFASRLLHEAKVAVVPGIAFGANGKGFVRASFSTSYDRLIEATERIEGFVEKIKR